MPYEPSALDLDWKKRLNGYSPETLEMMALHAISLGTEWHIEQLLDKGLNIEMEIYAGKEKVSMSLLHIAVENDDVPTARLLLKRGAEQNPDENVDYPLIKAARNGQLEMVNLLISHKADVAQMNGDDETAMSVAKNGGHTDVIKVLEAALPKKSPRNKNGGPRF